MAESENKEVTPLRRLFRMLALDKKDIILLYSYAIFSGIINLSLPLGIQAIISNILGGQINTSWGILVIVVTLGITVFGFIQVMQVLITEIIQRRIFVRSSFDLAYRVPRFKTEALHGQYGPELLNRFFDTLTIQKGLSKTLIDFSTSTLQIFFGLFLLSFYHPFFVLFGMFLAILLISVVVFTGPRGLETSLNESKYKYRVAYWLEEVARTMGTFKLAGQSDLPLRKVNKLVNGYLNFRKKHFSVLIFQFSSIVVFKILVVGGLLGLGSFLVLQQEINLGQFVASEIIILLVIASAEKIILSFESVYDVLTGLEKIGQVTDMEMENHISTDKDVFEQHEGLQVDFNDVTFTYPGGLDPAVKHATFSIAPGDKVCVTGKNDSGKTTLITLMAGLYDNYRGNILFNEYPLINVDTIELRENIGDTLGQEELFEGTLEENLTLGKNHYSEQYLINNMKLVGLEMFFKSLPMGINQPIAPAGRGLSYSIRQKILLARVLIGSPKLVLLDNAFYGLDYDEKIRIVKEMTNENNKYTMVAATNEPEVMYYFDKVIVIENGVCTLKDMKEYLKDYKG